MVITTAHSIESELKELVLGGMKKKAIIDLGNAGRYWEGGSLNNNRCLFGYGIEYNEENCILYEGFVFDDQHVCYGQEYRRIRMNVNKNDNDDNDDNDDNNDNNDMKKKKNGLMYEGGYVNGVRCGFGRSYDLNGMVEYEGEWLDNQPVESVYRNSLECIENVLFASMRCEELVIGENLFNEEDVMSISISPLLIRLRKIKIGNKCFQYVREFVLDGLEQLESVKIGEKCFRISGEKSDDGLLQITNCTNLTRNNIHYGKKSFYLTAGVQATSNFHSIPFSFSRCNCSRKLHSKSAERLGFLSIRYRVIRVKD